jgi:hypothetical protein
MLNIWTIAEIPDSVVAGLSTIFLVFQATSTSSLSRDDASSSSNLTPRSGRNPGLTEEKLSRSSSMEKKPGEGASAAVQQMDTPSSQKTSSSGGAGGSLREDTASRLFRNRATEPIPTFVYAHNLVAEEPKKEEKTTVCGCFGDSCTIM